jgi:hypothetical protein
MVLLFDDTGTLRRGADVGSKRVWRARAFVGYVVLGSVDLSDR